ncbi:hypothetical protein V6N13_039345 [Hibiscus sabdariffa]
MGRNLNQLITYSSPLRLESVSLANVSAPRCPPSTGFIKFNVDGAMKVDVSVGSIGEFFAMCQVVLDSLSLCLWGLVHLLWLSLLAIVISGTTVPCFYTTTSLSQTSTDVNLPLQWLESWKLEKRNKNFVDRHPRLPSAVTVSQCFH